LSAYEPRWVLLATDARACDSCQVLEPSRLASFREEIIQRFGDRHVSSSTRAKGDKRGSKSKELKLSKSDKKSDKKSEPQSIAALKKRRKSSAGSRREDGADTVRDTSRGSAIEVSRRVDDDSEWEGAPLPLRVPPERRELELIKFLRERDARRAHQAKLDIRVQEFGAAGDLLVANEQKRRASLRAGVAEKVSEMQDRVGLNQTRTPRMTFAQAIASPSGTTEGAEQSNMVPTEGNSKDEDWRPREQVSSGGYWVKRSAPTDEEIIVVIDATIRKLLD